MQMKPVPWVLYHGSAFAITDLYRHTEVSCRVTAILSGRDKAMINILPDLFWDVSSKKIKDAPKLVIKSEYLLVTRSVF